MSFDVNFLNTRQGEMVQGIKRSYNTYAGVPAVIFQHVCTGTNDMKDRRFGSSERAQLNAVEPCNTNCSTITGTENCEHT
jgi:hypothetical protein